MRTAWASFRGTELRLTLQDVTATRLFADSPVIVKVLGKQTVPAVIKDRAGSARELGGEGGSSGVGGASVQRAGLGREYRQAGI